MSLIPRCKFHYVEVFLCILFLLLGATAQASVRQQLTDEEKLASVIAETTSAEQRAELLARNERLVNSALRQALQKRIESAQKRGAYEQQFALAGVMLQVAQRIGDQAGAARATNSLGVASYLLSKFDAARSYYEQALQLAEQAGDPRSQGLALRNLGLLAARQSRLAQAQSFYQRSLQAFALDKDEDGQRDQFISTLHSSSADVSYRQGEYQAALQQYERGLTVGRRVNYAEGIAQALFGLGTLQRFLGNFAAAEQALVESLALMRRAGVKDKEAVILNNLGATYSERGNYRAALHCYQQSLNLKETLGDEQRQASTLNNIGLLHFYQRDDELALAYFQRSLQAAQKANNPRLAAYALNNLGLLHGTRGRHIASHSLLNDANPLYSQIVLARPGAQADAFAEGPAEDGLLETWEIMKLNLRTEIAVLSACETARGRIGAGEGVIGLSWAFFLAGTPTTVVSQWKVEAASTAELMREFHRQLQARAKQPPAKAAALRAAALKLLRSQSYRHPLYWAGFAIVGDAF